MYDNIIVPNSPPLEEREVPLQATTCQVIQQAIDLISILNDDQYTHSSKVMAGGTIGKHVRHVYDHFNLLYKQCDELPTDWVVDYDIRARNNPAEIDRLVAINNLKDIQDKIKCYDNISLNSKLTLLATIDPQDTNKYRFESSFGRELFYSCIHAIHHYASIKAICIEQDISVPYEFGMAPSTLQDQQQTKS